MPVYYTTCPAPVPVVKETVFNEILTLMRRFCTNKVELLTETAKNPPGPFFLWGRGRFLFRRIYLNFLPSSNALATFSPKT